MSQKRNKDNMKELTKSKAIKLAGSQVNLAKMLGITKGAVWQWSKIPELRLYQLKHIKPEWFK